MHTRGICHGHPAIEIKFVINSLLFRYFLEKKNYLQYVLYNIYTLEQMIFYYIKLS